MIIGDLVGGGFAAGIAGEGATGDVAVSGATCDEELGRRTD
jgi:hypothetical protein